jgi:hypothetical protein
MDYDFDSDLDGLRDTIPTSRASRAPIMGVARSYIGRQWSMWMDYDFDSALDGLLDTILTFDFNCFASKDTVPLKPFLVNCS